MKNLAKVDFGIKIISMVVPSVNGNWSKQLVISTDLHDKIISAAITNRRISQEYFALFMDSNLHHEKLNTGFGCLTKLQFDELIKSEYNSTFGYGKKNELKIIQ